MRANWALARVWHHETCFTLIFSSVVDARCYGLKHSMAQQRTVLVIVQQDR